MVSRCSAGRLLAAVLLPALLLAACGGGGGASGPRAAGGAGAAGTTTLPPSNLRVPTVTSQPLNIPAVRLAEETACLTDAQVIRMAEYYYSTVNGHFGSIPDLVEARFLQTASSYFSGVKIGAPAGGYTMLPVPTGPCGPHVVTAAQNAG